MTTASTQPTTAICTVSHVPCRRPGRNMLLSPVAAMAAIAISAATSIAASEKIPMAKSSAYGKNIEPLSGDGADLGSAPKPRLLTLAELFHRLVRQVVLAEPERRHQRDMLGRPDELLQLGVEGFVKILVFLAEAEAAMTLHGLAGDLAERRGRFHALALLRHVGDGKRGQRGGIGAPGLHGSQQARLIGQHDQLRHGNAGVLGIAVLDCAGHHREMQVLVAHECRIVLDAPGIAFRHQHRLADAIGRLGERDLSAALGIDEHAGGDDVEAAGLQTGNERAEFRQYAVDLGNADLGQYGFRYFRRLAGQLAVGRRIAEGRFVRKTDADEALRLGALQGGLGECQAGPAGDRDRRRAKPDCRQQQAAPRDPQLMIHALLLCCLVACSCCLRFPAGSTSAPAWKTLSNQVVYILSFLRASSALLLASSAEFSGSCRSESHDDVYINPMTLP